MDAPQRKRLLAGLLAALSLVALASCGMTEDEVSQTLPQGFDKYITETQPVKTKDISGFCKVKTDRGQIDIDEYLASVVSCEAAYSAGLEALKAQAIAARSFALHVNFAQNRPLRSSQADQHYACGRPVRELARQAVKETTGVVAQYNETLVALFYKAGSERQSATCRGIGPGATNTEHYITYNEGKRGSAVQGAYNQRASNDNRGDMSQWGAVCLENKGKKALDILRFYYGEDIETVQLQGPCVGNTVDENVLTDGALCTASAERPEIIERAEWGARPSKGSYGNHTPNRFSIHHAVSPNNDGSDAASRIRGFQNYHMDGHGWNDIGYHFLIDQKGRIYRGTPEGQIGAHVGGHNSGNLGICFLGQYHPPERSIPAAEPTEAALKAAGRLISYLGDKYNINVDRSVVKGHRENPGQSTSCPGDLLLNKIPEIINYAGSGAVCGRPERPYDEVRDAPKFDLKNTNYQYVKIQAISEQPEPYPANFGGFEVDSVFIQQSSSGAASYAASVHSKSNGVINPDGALGAPNNSQCASRSSRAAVLPKGEHIVLKFNQSFTAGHLVSLVQGEFHGLSDCSPGYSARVWVSPDARNWVEIRNEVASNVYGMVVPTSYVHFMTPRADGVYASGSFDLSVEASPDVQEVEYFVGGTSVGTGTDWEDYFRLAHQIEREGKFVLTAKAKDNKGRAIASETITIELSNAFRFASPRPGPAGMSALSGPNATFKVVGGPADLASVSYEADGYPIGNSSSAASGYKVDYHFDNLSGADGLRHVVAYGKNSSNEVIVTAELDVIISDNVADKLEWVYPTANSWKTPRITLRTRRLDPAIISVDYETKDGKAFCRSDNPNTSFACTHEFKERGWVEIVAVGFDTKAQLSDPQEREEHKIAEISLKVFITNNDGTIPGRSISKSEPLPQPGTGGGFGTGEADSAMAEKLAREGGKCSGVGNGGQAARCNNGVGGYSTGSCWGFVKAAIIRSGLASRADIDRLAAKVGMSAYRVQVGAEGFTVAADRASPEALAQTMGLKKINVPPNQAPRGAIVGWPAGCNGYHPTYGHIEISQGNGIGCSDYCGRLGSASCGRVFVPIK